jgi:regulator of replication initiation timing
MAKTTSPGLEPIDRLEEKIKLLVGTIGRLKGEQTRLSEENARLGREVEALQARLSDAQGETAELSALRDERDIIRSRVGEMLQQLESLSL